MSWKANGIWMWIVVALVTSSSACASGKTTFNSRVEVANAGPVKRLVVFESVESPGFGHDMRVGLAAALTNRLSMCGVTARLLHAQSSDPDPAARVAAYVKEFQADAVLLIKAAGGVVVNGDETESALIFELKLIETAALRMTWQARAMFEVRSQSVWINDTDSGANFGTSIVSRLRDDRVLAGCPALPAGWPEIKPRPGCREERQRVLAKAHHEANRAERLRLISTAPTCE
jgi:hypothetical protein